MSASTSTSVYKQNPVNLIAKGSISSRAEFGRLLEERGLTGYAVEVGTHRGEFARQFMGLWPLGRLLYCVDPWENLPGYEEQAAMLDGGGQDREWDYRKTEALLRPYLTAGRCELLRQTSEQAAKTFPDSALDFVYLDGDHETEAVARDLERWWPKLRPGGVMAGHDFVCPGEHLGGWGGRIQPAVFDFAKEAGRVIYMVPEPDNSPWSFYMVK